MKKDTYSYRGWLNSDFFWKRAAAVVGHQLGFYSLLLVISFVVIAAIALFSVFVLHS